MRARWNVVVALLGVAGMTSIAGCAETMSLGQLPAVAKVPERLLTKEEQKRSMNEMMEKGQTHHTEAAKEIEKAR